MRGIRSRRSRATKACSRAGVSLSGTIVPNKSSFSFTAQQRGSSTPAISSPRCRAAPLRARSGAPADRMNINGRFDQALNSGHMLRFSFQRNAIDRRNLGVGGYDLPERAYATEQCRQHAPHLGERPARPAVLQRVAAAGALDGFREPRRRSRRRRSACSTRSRAAARSRRAAAAPSSSKRRPIWTTSAARTRMRAGVLLEGGRYRSTTSSNYLGTYTFASLRTTRRAARPTTPGGIGDPNVALLEPAGRLYVQDDYRLAQSLLLSYGAALRGADPD